MLERRVLTAVFLLTGLLLAVFFLPASGWAALVAAIAGLAGWEFGRLAGFSPAGSWRYGASVGAICLALGFSLPSLLTGVGLGPVERGVLALSAAFWLGLAPFWLHRRWPLGSAPRAAGVGLLVIVPTWLALVVLWRLGPATLFGVMALVWIADIAAYFVGRRFGKRKLAPSISPGKTWEGAGGALIGVTAYGLALAAGGALPAIPGWMLLVLLPLLTLLSIEGDLFESMLKRQAGLKDSSQLLPGHGGILDRIDALTSTLPLAALILAF